MEDLFATDDQFTVVKPGAEPLADSFQNANDSFTDTELFYQEEQEDKQKNLEEEEEEEDYFHTESPTSKSNSTSNYNTSQPVQSSYDPLALDQNQEKQIEEDILGLENVNIKSRKKVVVLSDEQLLSDHGLIYIKSNFNKRVRFKTSARISKNDGKKHVSFTAEYENATKMLNFYQLWAHKVFPKADFQTFIDICYSKASLHKGRIAQYRRQWIEEEQNKYFGDKERGNVVEEDNVEENNVEEKEVVGGVEKESNVEEKEQEEAVEQQEESLQENEKVNSDDINIVYDDEEERIIPKTKKSITFSDDEEELEIEKIQENIADIEEQEHEEEMALLREMGL